MNGRIYSPSLGRMLSPDPVTQAPENGQNYNRYTYAFNNPLKYSDPSGYEAATVTGIVIKTAVTSLINAAVNLLGGSGKCDRDCQGKRSLNQAFLDKAWNFCSLNIACTNRVKAGYRTGSASSIATNAYLGYLKRTEGDVGSGESGDIIVLVDLVQETEREFVRDRGRPVEFQWALETFGNSARTRWRRIISGSEIWESRTGSLIYNKNTNRISTIWTSAWTRNRNRATRISVKTSPAVLNGKRSSTRNPWTGTRVVFDERDPGTGPIDIFDGVSPP